MGAGTKAGVPGRERLQQGLGAGRLSLGCRGTLQDEAKKQGTFRLEGTKPLKAQQPKRREKPASPLRPGRGPPISPARARSPFPEGRASAIYQKARNVSEGGGCGHEDGHGPVAPVAHSVVEVPEEEKAPGSDLRQGAGSGPGPAHSQRCHCFPNHQSGLSSAQVDGHLAYQESVEEKTTIPTILPRNK